MHIKLWFFLSAMFVGMMVFPFFQCDDPNGGEKTTTTNGGSCALYIGEESFTDIPLDSAVISIEFSEKIDDSTIEFEVTDGENPISEQPEGKMDAFKKKFKLSFPAYDSEAPVLEVATEYSIVFKSGLKAQSGTECGGFTVTFTTVADMPTGPVVVQNFPAGEAVDVPTKFQIVLYFDQEIVAETGSITVTSSDGTEITGTGFVAPDTQDGDKETIYAWDPSTTVPQNEVITVAVNEGFESKEDGTTSLEGEPFSFTIIGPYECESDTTVVPSRAADLDYFEKAEFNDSIVYLWAGLAQTLAIQGREDAQLDITSAGASVSIGGCMNPANVIQFPDPQDANRTYIYNDWDSFGLVVEKSIIKVKLEILSTTDDANATFTYVAPNSDGNNIISETGTSAGTTSGIVEFFSPMKYDSSDTVSAQINVFRPYYTTDANNYLQNSFEYTITLTNVSDEFGGCDVNPSYTELETAGTHSNDGYDMVNPTVVGWTYDSITSKAESTTPEVTGLTITAGANATMNYFGISGVSDNTLDKFTTDSLFIEGDSYRFYITGDGMVHVNIAIDWTANQILSAFLVQVNEGSGLKTVLSEDANEDNYDTNIGAFNFDILGPDILSADLAEGTYDLYISTFDFADDPSTTTVEETPDDSGPYTVCINYIDL